MPQYAGVDLGSNSFHMVLGRVDKDGRVTFVDQQREYVRLAGGLDADNVLSEVAMARALACLGRFGQRLAHVQPERVRIVGTNTLRKAKNAEAFVERCEKVLGHRIDVISGLEEARLIYLGVSASFSRPGTRLVIDIGGGSTELMLGDAQEASELDSLFLGCVEWTRRFFPDGRITEARFEEAEIAARREFAPVVQRYRDRYDHVVGSSGTARAADKVLVATDHDGVTPRGLAWLREQLVRAGHVSKVDLPEVSSERAQVLPGGLAILEAAMRSLHLEHLTTVDTALREGILLELVGRQVVGDMRERTVHRMQSRFGVDVEHAERVATTVGLLYDQVTPAWRLPEGSRQWLLWAAQLHEIGQFLRFSGYHRHGAYLLSNADLPGFSRQEQRALAALVLGHRGRFDLGRLEELRPAKEVPPELVLLLRVAARLHRTRSPRPRPVVAQAGPKRLSLRFPEGWLATRPLSVADLDEEREQCAKVGIALDFQ